MFCQFPIILFFLVYCPFVLSNFALTKGLISANICKRHFWGV